MLKRKEWRNRHPRTNYLTSKWRLRLRLSSLEVGTQNRFPKSVGIMDFKCVAIEYIIHVWMRLRNPMRHMQSILQLRKF
jgi:hypothetical protein